MEFSINYNYETPLDLAIGIGNIEIAELLEKKLSLNANRIKK